MTKILKVSWINIEIKPDYTSTMMEMAESDIQMLCRQNHIYGLDKDDIAQELRFQLWKATPRYHPEKCGFRTWSLKVMKNKLKNLYRDSRLQKRIVQYYVDDFYDD